MKMSGVKSGMESLVLALDELSDAIVVLEDGASDELHKRMYVDAVIKRFEVTFEYCWKLMKAASEYQGSDAPGPRPAIQKAIRFGWIDEPEFWAEALDARNGSVHGYFGISRDEYIKMVKRFVKEARKVLKSLESDF